MSRFPVELDIEDGNRIAVRFPYDEEDVALVRTVAGRRWSKNAGAWLVPLDWQSARELRRIFGDRIVMSRAVRRWGRAERARQAELKDLAAEATSELDWLPRKAPALAEALHLGPKGLSMSERERREALAGPPSFQVSDVAFMARSDNPLNANHMGLGKTIETIAAVIEGDYDEGPCLVVAPISAAEGTWPGELAKWQDKPAWLARGTAAEKRAIHEEFSNWVSPQDRPRAPNGEGFIPGNAGWLIINPAQLQLIEDVETCPAHAHLSHKRQEHKSIIKACSDEGDKLDEDELVFYPKCLYRIREPYPELFRIKWNVVIFDEAHEHGILNPKALTGMGVRRLQTKKKMILTGTPMGGREIRMFEILQFLNPKVFTSKWRFAEQYLEVGVKEFYKRGGGGATGTARTIGGIKRCPTHSQAGVRPRPGECMICDEYERRFFEQLNPYVLRRTKEEVLPDLPPKQYVDLWCPWGSEAHRKQYEKFAQDAEVAIEGGTVSALNVISEYTRLGQFSWGVWTKKDGKLEPTSMSGKLAVLEEKLQELGIFDKDGSEQAVIFSQYRAIVDLVHSALVRQGVAAGKLHGGTTRKGERAALKERFQGEGDLRVLVVSTKAGGTSLTLDRASHVFILDETWNPDNEEQAEDRCHRGSRIHQVTVYRLRTKGTIDEYKMETSWAKAAKNKNVLDLRRIKLREA